MTTRPRRPVRRAESRAPVGQPPASQPYMQWLRRFVGSAPLLMVCSAACIRDEQGRVLLMRRGGEASELWGFPGGAMELGETIRETTAREAREEVGLEVVPERLIGVYTGPELGFRYANGDQVQLVNFLFECRVVGGALRPDGSEALAARYFGPADPLPPLRPCCQAKLADCFAFRGEVFIR